jgi:sn-glycerol 3-phosphate transport system substrate-binding protein
MSVFKHVVAVVCLAGLAVSPALAAAPVEIPFWHSMPGTLGERLQELADRFNQSQQAYQVVLVYKGSSASAMKAALDAERSGNPPVIAQVLEAGTENMLGSVEDSNAKGKKARKIPTRPLYQVMAEAKQKFDTKALIPAIAGYYEDTKGHLLSFPFNSVTPVLYYNKDAFRKAGLDPEAPPKFWPAVQAAAQAILDSHATPCAFTTAWQTWIHVENLHARNNELFASQLNGFGGLKSDLVFNDQLEMRHIALLSAWHKGTLFNNYGPADEAEPWFYRGNCAMLTSTSASYPAIKAKAQFEVGVAELPYYEDYHYMGAPQNSIAGGSSLWVMAGKKPAEYKGAAQFIAFLAQPAVQAEWHQQTGYLPVTFAGYELSRKQGYYEKNPGAEVAVLQVSVSKGSPLARGIRLGNFAQIRGLIDGELETVWDDKKPTKQALDDAVKDGNELLRDFERANK